VAILFLNWAPDIVWKGGKTCHSAQPYYSRPVATFEEFLATGNTAAHIGRFKYQRAFGQVLEHLKHTYDIRGRTLGAADVRFRLLTAGYDRHSDFHVGGLADVDAGGDGSQPARAESHRQLENRFHQAMLEAYRLAKQQCGYNAMRFLQMVNEQGGLATARTLLNKKGPSDGLTTLWEHGWLNISMEALVLRPEFQEIFSDEERQVAREVLAQYGFNIDS